MWNMTRSGPPSSVEIFYGFPNKFNDKSELSSNTKNIYSLFTAKILEKTSSNIDPSLLSPRATYLQMANFYRVTHTLTLMC